MTRVVAILAHPDDAEILAGVPSTSTGSAATASRSVVSRIRPILCAGRRVRGGPVPRGRFYVLGPPRYGGVPLYTGGRRASHGLPPGAPPDLVLTHWLEDTHPDHVASVRLVIEALVHYAVAHGLEDVDASRRAFPQVWSCDTYGGLGESRGL